jgi:hypothetical protein
MRTKKFEERVANEIAYSPNVWLDSLRMSLIREIDLQHNVEYAGIEYLALGRYELNLIDGMHIIHIGQKYGDLDFYYFSITSDETSEECFDEFYEQSLSWAHLKNLKVK